MSQAERMKRRELMRNVKRTNINAAANITPDVLPSAKEISIPLPKTLEERLRERLEVRLGRKI